MIHGEARGELLAIDVDVERRAGRHFNPFDVNGEALVGLLIVGDGGEDGVSRGAGEGGRASQGGSEASGQAGRGKWATGDDCASRKLTQGGVQSDLNRLAGRV